MSFYKSLVVLISGLILVSSACSTAGSSSEAGDLALLDTVAGNNSEVMKTLAVSSSLMFSSSEYSGMTMFNINDISNVSIVGTNYNVPQDNPVNDVFAAEDFVFLALGTFDAQGGISIVNKADTNVMVTLVTRDTVANANSKALVVTGTAPNFTAYVADENLGLAIYTIVTTGPTINAPSTFPLSNAQPAGLVLDGTTAYIACKTSGVYVITGLPGSPKIAAQISTEISDARGVALSGDGNTLFIADRMLGVWAYNVSTPAKPKYVGNYATPGEANAVVANGDDVYVADGSGGILWLDFTTPSQPFLKKESSDKQGIVWDIVLVNSFIVGAYGPEGIKVFSK